MERGGSERWRMSRSRIGAASPLVRDCLFDRG
jgi:hypothetical protein